MRALTVAPRRPGSARVEELPEPVPGSGELLVEGIAVGVCGTDREITAGRYGAAPPGRERLVLGHESLGRVASSVPGGPFARGDLVVGVVRRPDPDPCAVCAAGEWDMCVDGRFGEHGIAGLDGFAAERYVLDPAGAVGVPAALGRLGVLVEPASVVAKAWEHIERIGGRAAWFPERVLVTGAGPIGLLAALFAVQRGHDVRVVDRMTSGPKPDLVRDLGAEYHAGPVADASGGVDVVVECTGVDAVVADVLTGNRRSGIVCLTGVSSGGRRMPVDVGAFSRELVLENDVVFGSVNANLRHYDAAVDTLAGVDPDWLARLLTRTVPLDDAPAALVAEGGDDIKVVVELDGG